MIYRRIFLDSVGDVYISPAIYSERRATKDSIKKLQTVWVEFDGEEYIDFGSVSHPTLIVQTSFSSHVHCYWRLDKPALQSTVEDINRRLTFFLKADSSGWDAVQLLRPPGTINRKHGLPVLLSASEKTAHPVGSFGEVPQVSAPPTEVVQIESVLSVGEVLKAHQLPLQLVRMVKRELPDRTLPLVLFISSSERISRRVSFSLRDSFVVEGG